MEQEVLLLKNIIRKIFSFFGYEIISKENGKIIQENFQNLVEAYQYQLNKNDRDFCQPGNELRASSLARLQGTSPSQAFEIISALTKTMDIPGDVCEFGVAQGETSALIANEISSTTKMLHLFDSFEGLPAPTEKDHLKDDIFSLGSMNAYKGEMACPIDMVKHRLAMINFPSDKYRIHQGYIENLINRQNDFPEVISFAYVDFDFYEPIRITLEYLEHALSAGGKIVVDDYDFFSTGAKTAVDEFIEKMNSANPKYNLEVADQQLGHFAIISKL